MSKPAEILCNVCNKNRFRFLFKNRDRMHDLPGDFNFYACCGCGLVVYRPRLESGALSLYYPKDYYSYEAAETKSAPVSKKGAYYLLHPIRAANALFYSKIMGQNRDASFRTGQAVLDVGCGDGRYLLEGNKKGCKLYGVDIDSDALDRFKKKSPGAETFCGNLWEAGFEEASFDFIHLSHVAEHVEEIERLLKEVCRILRHEGEMRLQIPNTSSFTRLLFGKFWIHWDAPRHIYGFSVKNFSALCRAAGLEVVRKRTLENSFSILGSVFYLYKELSGRKIKLGRVSAFWDSELLKLMLFPYCFLVNVFGIGDTVEFVLKKKETELHAGR